MVLNHSNNNTHTCLPVRCVPQDVHRTKSLHDAVSAAADFPATSMQQYLGAYFEARCGPRYACPLRNTTTCC